MQNVVPDTSASWENAPTVEVESPFSAIDNGTSAVPPLNAWSSRIWPDYGSFRNAIKNPDFPSYGRHGTETTLLLEETLSKMQGMDKTMLCTSGTQANSLALHAAASQGGHILIPENAYTNTIDYAEYLQKEHGVEVTYYDPQTPPEDFRKFLRKDTTAVFMEVPSSITLECMDVEGYARVIRDQEKAFGTRIRTIADATYLTPSSEFLPALGIDVVTHSLTKYPNGTSSVFLGSISSSDKKFMERAHELYALAGNHTTPESARDILASIQHMIPRVQKSAQNAVEVVNHIAAKPGVKHILHPGNPASPGYAHWQTQLKGRSNGLFTLEFDRELTPKETEAFCDALGIGIGYSWGGTESIQLPTHISDKSSQRAKDSYQGTLIRFHIGQENVEEIKQRFDKAFTALEKQQQKENRTVFGAVGSTVATALGALKHLLPVNDNRKENQPTHHQR